MSRFIPAALFAICAVTPGSAQNNVRLHDGLQEVLDTFRDRYDFPGPTAAVDLPDGTVIVAATGLADVEAGTRMTPDSRMLAASIGKTFVAATVLQLEGDGRLSRADLLADHLGDRAWFDSLLNAGTITSRRLLQHSAGLPDHVYLPVFQASWAQLTSGDGAIDPEGIIGLVTGKEPLSAAGSAWAYSDTGYLLLGLVIEEVTGAPKHCRELGW